MKIVGDLSISSCSNPLIKYLTSLRQVKNREKEGAFIFEGSKLFSEAIDWQISLQYVLISQHWLERSKPEFISKLERTDASIIMVSDAVMSKCSFQKQPEGIFCCGKKPECVLPEKKDSIVVLENVQDPGNVGTIIRTSDAAGYSVVISTAGTADCYNEKVIRASMGSVFHLPIIQHQSAIDVIRKLKSFGYFIVGSSLEGNEDYFITPPTCSKKAVILGNESSGMSDGLQKECDCLMRIPMFGNAESLNVSVAAGLMLYQYR